jgi:hypothetical protein
VADTRPSGSAVPDLLQQLDDLLAEAMRLRDRIDRAMAAKIESPFWPDRRRRVVEDAEERAADHSKPLRRRSDPTSAASDAMDLQSAKPEAD